MKKLFLLVIALVLTVSVDAKSLRELWLAMPDSLLPTLDKNLRLELLDLVDMKVKPEVKNLLEEECRMDTLTSDFLEVTTSPLEKVQMCLLPMETGDSILCVVKKILGPAMESEVRFYDSQWNESEGNGYLPSDISQLSKYLKEKPDTLDEDKYRELVSLIEPVMVSVTFSNLSDTLVFSVSIPLASNDEKEKLNSILLQRKFKWGTGRFNEI